MTPSSRYSNIHLSYSIPLNQGQEQEFYDHQILLHRHSLSSLQSQDQLPYLYMGSQIQPSPYQQEVEIDDKLGSYGVGSYDQTTLEINKGESNSNLKFTICKKEEQIISGSSVKWMPLTLRKKMTRPDEDQKKPETRQTMSKTLTGKASNISSSDNDNNTPIRACSDCNTTKTPLWRSGPRGPKSLCNACGIRQRKARRALAMTANGLTPPSSMSSSMMRAGKKTANNNNAFGAHKKRSKVVKPSRDNQHINNTRKLCFEEFFMNLSKQLSLQHVFPKEEKEAAILLMALSCDIVHG